MFKNIQKHIKSRSYIYTVFLVLLFVVLGYQGYTKFETLYNKVEKLSSQQNEIKSQLRLIRDGQDESEEEGVNSEGDNLGKENIKPINGEKKFEFSKSDDVNTVANKLAMEADFPIILPKGVTQTGSYFTYIYTDYGKVGIINDFEYIFLGGNIFVNDIEVRLSIMSDPEGPICTSFYSIKSNLGELQNCVVVQTESTLNEISFNYPLKNNRYNEELSYRYVINGNYSKSDITKIFSDLVLYKN